MCQSTASLYGILLLGFESSPGNLHLDTVERCSCGDEQCFVVLATKTDIGWTFGNTDRLDEFPIRIVNIDLIGMGGIEIPMNIHAHAIAGSLLELYHHMLAVIASHGIGNRPDRLEPRQRKRRPKPYDLMTKPRSKARKQEAKKR